MEKYPTLTEMGITNPEDITRYSLQTVNNVDCLRIVYKRKKGSLLASSRKFRFGRSPRMIVTDGGKNETTVVHEISPFLSKATDELKKVVDHKHTLGEKKEIIAEEMSRLEEEVNSRMAYIKSLVEGLV